MEGREGDRDQTIERQREKEREREGEGERERQKKRNVITYLNEAL